MAAAYTAIVTAIWLVVRVLRSTFGSRPIPLRSTIALVLVHLLAICAGVGLALPSIYQIAAHPTLPLTTPIEMLPGIADAIGVFVALGLVAAVVCLLLLGLSFLTRRSAGSSQGA